MVKKKLIGALLLVLSGFIGIAPVSAHSVLQEATPSAGAELDEPVNTVELWFNTKIENGSSLYLTTEEGEKVEPATVEIKDKTLIAKFSEDLSDGVYQVNWEVLGADGHIISNQYSFTVSAGQDINQHKEDSEKTQTETESNSQQDNSEVSSDETETGNNSGSYVIIILLVLAGAGLIAWMSFSRSKK
ncbi:copper resistance CopC family protein [Virgibacillus kekensis]